MITSVPQEVGTGLLETDLGGMVSMATMDGMGMALRYGATIGRSAPACMVLWWQPQFATSQKFPWALPIVKTFVRIPAPDDEQQ
ncbi:hypothetical protein [Noviherbaspirillum soli]|uniref:hypothetical protein n=1 Tax=Noviherbaspirillum soli TaxID=1064518 RepID=UPI00188A5416|nr:hypothetical protein [Noviherbaspirillum soli]